MYSPKSPTYGQTAAQILAAAGRDPEPTSREIDTICFLLELSSPTERDYIFAHGLGVAL